MAKDKKSFLLYTDLISVVDELSDEEAGLLFKHTLMYVNDMNPEPPNRLIKLLFEPIKLQLKRDLNEWNNIRKKRAESGKLGGLQSGISRITTKQNEANEAIASNSKQNEANEAVNVTVTVNDNVINEENNTSVLSKKEKLTAAIAATQKRKDEFYNSLIPFTQKYPKDMVRDFFNWWSELNKTKTKMRFEQQTTWETPKRLVTWANRNKEYSNKKSDHPAVASLAGKHYEKW